MGANISRNDVAIVDGNPFQSIQLNRNNLAAVDGSNGSPLTEINRMSGIVIESKYPYSPPPPSNGALIDQSLLAAIDVGALVITLDAARMVAIDSKIPYVPPPPRPGSDLDRATLIAIDMPDGVTARVCRGDAIAVDAPAGVLTLDALNVSVIDVNNVQMRLDASRLIVIDSKYYPPSALAGGGGLRHPRMKR